ncbi:hypothetical protein O181_052478 [Austropuccinia psidii MF-1]|uniref:Uncharacterized protein n=1 Tax=Austropuccinia psidii MF-1 TaxID=1389203 RepID=A0A9Q3E2N8_9BASI|nr:hypothetical protein [Austropuccinia psidii MF-1]
MPAPQSTEGDGAEGEDSMSSVSLELMTKDLCKQKNLRHQNNALKASKHSSRKWVIPQLWPPSKSSKVKVLVLLGLKHYPGPPLQLWGGQVIDGPGPSQWAQDM